MKSKLILPLCLILIILACLFVCPQAYAPVHVKTLALHLYDIFEGTPWQKQRAYAGFIKWPEHFGHTRQEMYDLMDRETGGKFHANAYNARTHARGPCQVTMIAFKDITPPPGRSFFRYKNITTNRRIKFLNKKMAYDPYWNIYAGSACYARCKAMARKVGPQKIGEYEFTELQMSKMFYVSGIGTWRRSISPMLKYIQ